MRGQLHGVWRRVPLGPASVGSCDGARMDGWRAIVQQSQNEQLKKRQTDETQQAQEGDEKGRRGSDRKRRQSVQVDARGGPAISNGA